MKDKIYRLLPVFLQEMLITLFNLKAYRSRHGKYYKEYLKSFKQNERLSRTDLMAIQRARYTEFMKQVYARSHFYRDILSNVESYELIDKIERLPILGKEDLRKNLGKLKTVNTRKDCIVSKTGGTTGTSLTIYFTKRNMQERFAMLDNFRGQFGYTLGKRTAWFSGKALLNSLDVKNNRFWKTDWYHNVRYYSTFHVNVNTLRNYLDNIIQYRPKYLVGFPSTILEIAKYGLANGYDFPANIVKAIFPTAETVTAEMRGEIESFFKTRIYNQYASSEGAPFIFECIDGNLHLELQSGVFEVLDNEDKPTKSGRLIVTSFTTEGTPLIRYDIGDTITLEDEHITCNCGNNNPLVKEILGRADDFIYSPETGKINLGNVSNTLKDTVGIMRFQVIQDELTKIRIRVVKDDSEYSDLVEKKFIRNWRDRIGTVMEIQIEYVDHIPVEASGKFRIVKNNIKHLI